MRKIELQKLVQETAARNGRRFLLSRFQCLAAVTEEVRAKAPFVQIEQSTQQLGFASQF